VDPTAAEISIWELQNKPCIHSLPFSFVSERSIALVTDASDFAIYASLEQKCDNHWKLVGFLSWKLLPQKPGTV
jgi:hypothetical protein